MDDESEVAVINEHRLGVSGDDIQLDSSEENQTLILELVSQAAKTIDIFTRDMASRVYDDAKFIAAARDLIVRNDKTRVRILIIDPDKSIKHGHRIIELARRLSSSIDIRHVHVDYRADSQSYLIADGRGILHRKLASRYEAIVNFNNPLWGRELLNHFNEIWEHSQPILDFKRLHI